MINYLESKLANKKILEITHNLFLFGSILVYGLAGLIYLTINREKSSSIFITILIIITPLIFVVIVQLICGGRCPFLLLKRYYKKNKTDNNYKLSIKGFIPNLIRKYLNISLTPRNIIILLCFVFILNIFILLLIFY